MFSIKDYPQPPNWECVPDEPSERTVKEEEEKEKEFANKLERETTQS